MVCSQTLQPLGTDVMSSLAPICSSNSVGGRTGVNIVFIKYQFIQVLVYFKSFSLDLISKKMNSYSSFFSHTSMTLQFMAVYLFCVIHVFP